MINGKASGWEKVTSGVPQGSVLGPTLFIIYINDIDDGITSSLLKFADDTKLLRKVGTQDDCEELQKDLHRMYKGKAHKNCIIGQKFCLHHITGTAFIIRLKVYAYIVDNSDTFQKIYSFMHFK